MLPLIKTFWNDTSRFHFNMNHVLGWIMYSAMGKQAQQYFIGNENCKKS